MRYSIRQGEILKLVRHYGSCSIEDLARRLDVSGETIRRNVKPLAAEGLVEKVHGGIVLPQRFQEPPIQLRMGQQEEAKDRIGALVAAQIEDGDSLIIDTGSTTAYVARALAEHRELVVITNSAYIGNFLAPRNGNRVFLTGGELRQHDSAAFGPDAIAFVQRFEVRHAVLSMAALHAEKGCMDHYLCEAEFSAAVIGQAEQVIVATDATKFSRTSLVKVCDLTAVDTLVTDQPPDAKLSRALSAARVTVLVAERGAEARSQSAL